MSGCVSSLQEFVIVYAFNCVISRGKVTSNMFPSCMQLCTSSSDMIRLEVTTLHVQFFSLMDSLLYIYLSAKLCLIACVCALLVSHFSGQVTFITCLCFSYKHNVFNLLNWRTFVLTQCNLIVFSSLP